MITSPIELLNLQNFRNMTISTLILGSREKKLLMTSLTKIMVLQTLFQNTFILRKPGVTIFSEIIKVVTMFIRAIFKNSKTV